MSETNGMNGWMQWSKHVLKELERLDSRHEEMNAELMKIRIEIAKLQVKAGVWGLVGGAIPVAVGLAIMLLKGAT